MADAVGFIGTGLMGGAMVRQLLAAGHAVVA
jgi:3-hydroxyisobutyrate dehydrogenase-like beta-hydroxyacid dehydrogenase